jgi:isopentenyldiphosphate isomerase
MSEYFDLYDRDGHVLGLVKPRDQVHRDGDWHRSVALWIVRADGRLLLQRRSMAKDTWPGLLTASVSGHYAAGEHLEDVLREAHEEIGVWVVRTDLIPLGLWRHDLRPSATVIDRELVDAFLWPLDRPLTAFAPDPAEVSGLAELAAADLLALLEGQTSSVSALYCASGANAAHPLIIGLQDLVPVPDYHSAMARAALAYTVGGPAAIRLDEPAGPSRTL